MFLEKDRCFLKLEGFQVFATLSQPREERFV